MFLNRITNRVDSAMSVRPYVLETIRDIAIKFDMQILKLLI